MLWLGKSDSQRQHPLVAEYRYPGRLKAAISHSEVIGTAVAQIAVHWRNYADIVWILRKNSRWFTRAERVAVLPRAGRFLTSGCLTEWAHPATPRSSPC